MEKQRFGERCDTIWGKYVGLHGDEYNGNISASSVAEWHWDALNLSGSEMIPLAVKSSHSSTARGREEEGEVSEHTELWSEAHLNLPNYFSKRQWCGDMIIKENQAWFTVQLSMSQFRVCVSESDDLKQHVNSMMMQSVQSTVAESTKYVHL